MIIETKTYIDNQQREIEQIVSLENQITEPFDVGLKDFPQHIPLVDFSFFAIVEVPIPIAQGPMGMPILVMKRVRLPITNVGGIAAAFDRYNEVKTEFDNWFQTKMQEKQSEPKLIVPPSADPNNKPSLRLVQA